MSGLVACRKLSPRLELALRTDRRCLTRGVSSRVDVAVGTQLDGPSQFLTDACWRGLQLIPGNYAHSGDCRKEVAENSCGRTLYVG